MNQCLVCKTEFEVHNYRKNVAKFCSYKCYWESMKGKSGNALGYKHTLTTKQKMSEAKIGRPSNAKGRKNPKSALNPQVFKKGMTAWNTGIKVPQMTGNKHPNWIVDRTKLKVSEKKHLDVKYIYWMRSVKNRDGWKCKINNQDCSGRLESHHILNWVDYKELRYDINNGITLCHFHHPRKWEEEKRLSPYFMELVSVSKDIL